MLKRISSILLITAMLFCLFSCNNISTDPNTNTNDAQDTDSSTDVMSSNDDKSITLVGDVPYKIVYAEGAKTQAETLLERLKQFDKNTNFTASPDSEADSGTPEILIGATNRTASTEAKALLPLYLDYVISVTDNKIAIFANTEERLKSAVNYFIAKLSLDNDGKLCYPTSDNYVGNYKKYTYPSLKINDASIDKFSLVIPVNAIEQEKKVAEDLAIWFALNTGHMLPVITDDKPSTDNEIIIGNANRVECDELYSSMSGQLIYYSACSKNGKLLLYANNPNNYSSAVKVFTDSAKKNNGDVKNLSITSNNSQYSGKKAIFIGNSFIYWGTCVTFITNDDANEEIRIQGGDKGYFNEVCKANGIDMDVYNYTYGGKNLDWIYTNKISKLDSSFLDDIDYVFISEAGQNSSSFKATFKKIAALFKNAEDIVYLAHANTFSGNATNVINALPELANEGYKIVAWGSLVYNVYNQKVAVPGATKTYNKNTFIKNASSSEKVDPNATVTSLSGYGDSHHQNPLSGYITAQMCFSAITGASAVGQKYDFCWDKTIAPQYDLENFLTYQYGNGQTSNFIEVFNSSADMTGLQTLMDQYMAKYN